MKQLLLLVSLILLGTIAIRDSYKEQPSLADPNNPLSLTCPEYLPAEHNINANLNFAKPVAGLKNIDQNWYAAALENITKEEYNISYSDELGTYQSPNRANNMRFTYHKDGFTAQPRETKIPLFDLNDRKLRDDEKNYKEIEDWSIELKMESGKWKIENGKLKVESGKWKMENGKLKMENGKLKMENGEWKVENGKRRMENGKLKIESGEWKVDCSEMRIANAGSPPSGGARGGVFEDNSLEVAANKAWIEDDNIRIDYTNTKQGMRQDFIIKNKPEKDGNLQIVMNAVTDLEMDVSNDEVRFSSAAGEKMQYASLKAWDAAGKTLDVYFEKRDESHFAIVVDDRDAEYPVTVDPLSSTPDWWHAGDQPNSYFGNCAAAGDVNGDGFDDVIISAEGYDNGQTDEGRVFAFYGSSAGLPGAANWSAEIDQEGADFGTSISSAGDVNGDGFSDVLIGAVYYDNGQVNEGGAFVYYGSASGLSAVPNWTVESNQSGSWFGSVESAGDVNNDGYSDIIIGARHFDGTGKTFAYYGSAIGLSAEPNWTAVSDQSGSMFGAVVSSAGDVNSDGYSDVIVGAPFYSNGESMEGKCFVYLGSASGLAAGYSWTSESNQHGAWFGWHVANAGDVNGDGYDDVLIGAVNYDNGENNEGAAFVYYGSASGLSTTPNWIAEGNQSDCEFGTIISTAGDVNADGYSDILITAPSYDNDQINEGRVYVYKGSSEGIESNPCWTSDGNQQNCLYGHVSYTAGDVNGDGYSDIIIGATGYDNCRGRAFIFYGSPEQITLTPDFIVSCDQDFARFGFSVSGAGDVNGDGFDDVIIGAPTYQIDINEVGKVFAYYGSQNGLGTYPSWSFCLNFGYSLGWSVSGAGDVNGDGYSDVVFSKLYQGVYVFNGSQNGLGDLPDWSITNSPLNGIGYSVSSAGDVNNDGFSDIIIGSFNGYSYFGQIVCAHVFCGSQIGLPIDHIPSWTASTLWSTSTAKKFSFIEKFRIVS
jgi:anti-sigma28 factor (negative regulator of flagellin synthesis)